MMPTIHPTAIVHPSARIADSVRIGPYCVIEAKVT
ncbi:MAG: acyl-[acyl-carrier-protein]--UDP-N-acetylglucosamine O-acyltransferase, partial [Planctomycetota bacterium]|nr:acyl-[acyl-carrier-protein]--UDP-N-acetylglucosamine O-acyltransferase [Planctomycetota bacterium]